MCGPASHGIGFRQGDRPRELPKLLQANSYVRKNGAAKFILSCGAETARFKIMVPGAREKEHVEWRLILDAWPKKSRMHLPPPRLVAILAAVSVFSGCGSASTPQCTDEKVVALVTQVASKKIEEALVRADPGANVADVMSRISVTPTAIVTAAYDHLIDKYTCSSLLNISLPQEIAAVKDHHVFRAVALAKLNVEIRGNESVSSFVFSVYQTERGTQLMVDTQGLDAPAKFVGNAYMLGAFTEDLQVLPDLRAGLTLYNAARKHLLIEPLPDGSLQFHVSYDNKVCRPWNQRVTAERGDTLIYDNKEVGCSATFSRLGQIVLVEHQGCELMVEVCFPDGVYRKQ